MSTKVSIGAPKIISAVFAALTGFVLGGCVERELTITSDPPGAIVYVSDLEWGRTPITREFTWYGDYEVVFRLDGYQTHKTNAYLNPPLYEIPPLDLLSALAPWTYHDRRFFHATLTPQRMPSDEELIERAEALGRRNAAPVEK